MKKFKVWVSQHTNYIIKAKSAENAREQVWKKISASDSYNFGWTDKDDFMKHATVEEA
jgi:hypothetical protein